VPKFHYISTENGATLKLRYSNQSTTVFEWHNPVLHAATVNWANLRLQDTQLYFSERYDVQDILVLEYITIRNEYLDARIISR